MFPDSINEGMQVKNRISKIKNIIEGKLKRYYGRSFENASSEEMFQAVAMSIRDIILERGSKRTKPWRKRG